MTQRQKTIYEFLISFYNKNGYAPTLKEICEGCYTTSKQYIRECLWKFERMGLIEITDGRHRAIKFKQK